MIGKVLSNRYEIIEEIGCGGMAIVYKARCKMLNRYVAIKVLKDEYKVDAEFVKKFNRESQAAASLSNPNIVSVYDVGNDNDIYYIVMELVEGITLKEYIERNGMLNWRLALKFSIQISSALAHAHRNGIIHRDIKPHNIILSKDGNCKVADFGIASASNLNETKKLDEGILGSVHYISPEHAKGVIPDERSDIYSLGVTMYEMLTGKLPFDGDSAVSIAIKHLNQKPVPIKDINIAVPLGFVKIVEKAMNKDINLRYQSANEIIHDLEELSNDPDIFTPATNNGADLGETKLISKEEQEDIKKQISEIKQELDTVEHEDLTDEKKPKKKHRLKELFTAESKKDKVAIIAAIVTSVILIFSVAVIAVDILVPGFSFASVFSRGNREFVVPELEGRKVEDVKEEYKDYKIDFIVDEEVFNNDHEAGTIISHEPLAGMNVKLPVKIRLIVSKGPKEINLPRFIDKEYRQAQLEIKNLGLKYTEKSEYNDEVPEGYVINQYPLPNTVVKANDEVILTISKGVNNEFTIVPELIGLTEAEAKAKLADSNLNIGGIVRQASTKPAGTVIDQSVPPNSEITKKSKINITVSNGKKPEAPEKTPEVTQTPPPTTQPNNNSLKTYDLRLDLPTNKDEVTVLVKQSGKTVYNNKVKTSQKSINVQLTGNGQENIEVYFDGVLVKTQKINF